MINLSITLASNKKLDISTQKPELISVWESINEPIKNIHLVRQDKNIIPIRYNTDVYFNIRDHNPVVGNSFLVYGIGTNKDDDIQIEWFDSNGTHIESETVGRKICGNKLKSIVSINNCSESKHRFSQLFMRNRFEKKI